MEDLPESYTGPGLVDLQLNGHRGLDFNGDPSDWTVSRLLEVRESLIRRGVRAALPTVITDDPARMLARVGRYRELVGRNEPLGRFFPKVHVEGPFLSPHDGPRGMHPRRYCREPATLTDFLGRVRQASGDRIGIVTLAPELAGAIELIGRCVEAGICPALGHTQATNEQIDQAVAAGAKMSTHLGNGSHLVLPRLDNYVQRQLADDRLWAGFIADGHHMPFSTLRNFLRAKTIARSVLVTDAIAPTGLGPGRYESSCRVVEVSEVGRAAVPGQQNLAGSTLMLDKAVINVTRHCDVPFEQAWAMASTQPAALAALPTPEIITVRISEEGFCGDQDTSPVTLSPAKSSSSGRPCR